MIKFVAGCIRNDDDSCCVGSVNGYIDLNSIVQVIGSYQQISIFTRVDAAPIVVYWYFNLNDYMDDWMKLKNAIESLGKETTNYTSCGYRVENASKVIKTGDGYIGGFFYKGEGENVLAFDNSSIKVKNILGVASTKVAFNILNMIKIYSKYGCLYWVYDTEENMKNKIKEIQEALEEQKKND
jgi:hypothetical protein